MPEGTFRRAGCPCFSLKCCAPAPHPALCRKAEIAKSDVLHLIAPVMKISDFVFRYRPGHHPPQDALCRVRIFVSPPGEVVVLATDLGDLGTGVSVTNSIEWIYSALLAQGFVSQSSRIIEHYERDDWQGDSFDEVTFSDGGSPKWRNISVNVAIRILGCTAAEVEAKTINDVRLRRQAEVLRHRLNPFFDSPWVANHEEIARRLELQERMLPKQSLVDLVESGAGERSFL